MFPTQIASHLQTATHGLIACGQGAIKCTIDDLSTDGARITVAAGATVPDAFVLRSPILGSPRICRVAWRKDGTMGTWFDRAADF